MFTRLNERKELQFHAQQGRSVLMLAPRRVGKTWLLPHLAADLRDQGWMAIECDVQGMSQETEFLRHLCCRIEEQDEFVGKAKGRAKQFLNQLFASKEANGSWQQALSQMDWPSFAETLVRGLDEGGQDTLILVDELALFVKTLQDRDPTAAHKFLYGLRALQQRYRKVRWLFTGSIGLDTIAKRGEIGGALVDLTLFPLEPFDRPAARVFLEHLSRTGQVFRPFRLDEAAFDRLATELGWLAPYYLEKIANAIRPSGPVDPDGLPLATVQDVDAAFNTLLDPLHRNGFVVWEEHLAKNFPRDEADALRDVLGACARQPGGERLDTLFSRLGAPPWSLGRRALRDRLDVLITDGYLTATATATGEEEESRFRFRSGLLRRYWLRYHIDE